MTQFMPVTKDDMKKFKETLEAEARGENLTDDEAALLGIVKPDPTTDTQKPDPKAAEPKQILDDGIDWKKRYADQTRHTNELLGKERKAKEEVELRLKALEESRNASSTKNDEVLLEAFEKEYTEVAPVLKAYASKAESKALEAAQKAIEDEKTRQREESLKQALKTERLSTAHPDWATLKSDPIFNDWYTEQSPSVHRLGSSDDVEDVILVLDMFKREVKPAKAGQPKQDLTQAVSTKSTADIPETKAAFSMKLFEKEFDVAQRLNDGKKMERLLAAYDKAASENRLTQ